MPVSIKLPEMEIVYRQMWTMLSIYRLTRLWLIENDYIDAKGDTTMESAMEILYHWRKGTSMSPNEKELRIWWRTIKASVPVGTAGNRFYRHHMDIDWNVIQMCDVEIMREGKKEIVQQGEIRILIKPYIETPDITQIPLLKFFDNWFRTRLIKKNLEENKKMLYEDAYRLHGMLKKYLELKAFTPEMEELHKKFEFI